MNFERQVVVFTPFKNYGTSIHEYLMRDPSWVMCIGPQPFDGLIGPHCNVTATWWTDWELWLSLRDPFQRVASMWKYCVSLDGFQSFDEWLRQCLEMPHFGPATVLYRYTRLIRCESIAEELRMLGCDYGDFPVSNASELGDPAMTQDHLAAIERVHACDLHALSRLNNQPDNREDGTDCKKAE